MRLLRNVLVAPLFAVLCLASLVASPAGAARLSHTVYTGTDALRATPGPGGLAITIDDDEFLFTADPGQPVLPYRLVNLLLPQGHEVASFRVNALDARVLASSASVVRAQAARAEDGKPGVSRPLAVEADGNYPSERVRFLGTGTLHGYAIASFAVFPVRVEDGSVIAHERATLEVDTRIASGAAPVMLERQRPTVRARARAELSRLVVNPVDANGYAFAERVVAKRPGGFQATSFPSLEGSPVDYVVVCPDSLAAAFQPFADFKTARGVPTVIRTLEWIAANYRNGSDLPETVRTFAIEAYQKWGITYLLLGGDTQQVPPRFSWSNFYDGGRNLPTDMYFGCLDGDWNLDHDALFGEGFPADNPDLYAEVYVGRMPAASVAEVTMMTEKVFDYENAVDQTFENKVLLLGEVLFPMGWVPPQIITLNGADLTETIYNTSLVPTPGLSVTRMYETEELFPGSVDENRAAALAALNTGYNHVVHVGHGFRFNMSVGDASIVNADADALTNGNKLSCLYFMNCTGAAYTYYCLAEHFLRNPNGGAVSVVGSNESAFPNASIYYMNEFYSLAFDSNAVNIGETFARSRLPRTPLAVLSDNIDLWTHYVYTLLAEPQLPMWTGPVSPLSVAHVASVAPGTHSVLLTVTSGGNPVEGARVCLSKDDDDYAVGYTDGAGEVTLPFRAESAGSISVVATARNHVPDYGSVTVAPSGAYVALASMTIDDDNAGGTSGNGNGVIEGGETVDFGLTFTNTGSAVTNVVTTVLRTSDPGATLLDSTAAVGVILPGGNALATGGVRVQFDAALADEHAVPFSLVIKDNGFDTWTDTFKKTVHQPELGLVTLRIDDTGTGNGNGVVEAGEQFKLFYKVKNFGTGAYPGGTGELADPGDAFTFIDSTDTWGPLAPVASAENATGFVLVEPSVAVPHNLDLTITDAYGRVFTDTIELRAPTSPAAILVDPSLGPDRLRVTWNASASADVTHYNVYRALAPGGPYTRANADPVRHTLFVDAGLAANTLYYYRTTAVDVSGNESVVSSTSSGSTNPQQVAGWPIAVKVDVNTSPAVGDIDGDGDNEVVVCADRVYAWHADGTELLDGDNDPQTWGVLSPLGVNFVSHPALARLDLEPGLEIIAASRDAKLVYVFKSDGTVLPGWPRSVENTLRAGMVAGDLDGNNQLEIIAVDEKGVIYVWKTDGTELVDGDLNPATQGVFYRMPNCTFHYSTPAVADVDGDTKDELIAASQGDRVYVFNEDASLNAGWPYVLTSDVAGSPAVGDVDNNGDLEIVVDEWGGALRILNHDATQLTFQFFNNNPNGGTFFRGSPALANVTGDAKLEVFVARASGNLWGIASNGAVLTGWPQSFGATYTESSPVIADMDGNGILDIVLGNETQSIRGWNASGVAIAGFPLTTEDAMRGVPTITDVDMNGTVDLVGAGWDRNVYIWDFSGTWNAANAPWPRFHANLHNNGRIGYVVPTPVESASFAYTVMDGGFELVWQVPLSAGTEFTVERAEVVSGRAESYRRVGTSIGIGVDGSVRIVDRGLEQGSRYAYRLSNDAGTVHESMGLYVPVTHAALGQNFPNPFNPVTKIEYWVPEGTGGSRLTVSVEVYDVRGARVRSLVRGAQAAGRYVVEWDGRDERGNPSSSGVYFYRMVTPGFSGVRKMVLLK